MPRDRKLSTGETAAEAADRMMKGGSKPMWHRAGMTRDEYERGKAQNRAERRRAGMTDEVNEHDIVRR